MQERKPVKHKIIEEHVRKLKHVMRILDQYPDELSCNFVFGFLSGLSEKLLAETYRKPTGGRYPYFHRGIFEKDVNPNIITGRYPD